MKREILTTHTQKENEYEKTSHTDSHDINQWTVGFNSLTHSLTLVSLSLPLLCCLLSDLHSFNLAYAELFRRSELEFLFDCLIFVCVLSLVRVELNEFTIGRIVVPVKGTTIIHTHSSGELLLSLLSLSLLLHLLQLQSESPRLVLRSSEPLRL